MRFIFSQMAFFLTKESNRRNLRFMRKFFYIVIFLVTIYSFLFHVLMENEGQHFSNLTGLYWTLTVMSTLGFGDITFQSDIGKMFSILVMLSGIILFMLIMPFAFIRYIYVPWIEAQTSAATPKSLPEGTQNHTILVGTDNIVLSIADKLKQYKLPYCILGEDSQKAFDLFDRQYSAVLGDIDVAETYKKLRVDKAALVMALEDDLKNTNIAATVREVTSKTRLAASAQTAPAQSILSLAGCTYVFNFASLLGKSLARRVFNMDMHANIICKFESLCIAEAPATGTDLVGKTLKAANLRGRFGLNLVGIWHGHTYQTVTADSVIAEGAVLLLAGTQQNITAYEEAFKPQQCELDQPPVLILGGGRVGKSVADTLAERGIQYCLVDKNPRLGYEDDSHFVLGDAADIAVLEKAGINTTKTIVITTHNDDLNIYLSIYCNKLRPGIQIISRATLDRNIASLYNAGASLVMSQASLTANTVVNLLLPDQIFMLSEGMNIFRSRVSAKLAGKNLIESALRAKTGCNVVAIKTADAMIIPPDPHKPLDLSDELLLIGSEEDEMTFHKMFPQPGL